MLTDISTTITPSHHDTVALVSSAITLSIHLCRPLLCQVGEVIGREGRAMANAGNAGNTPGVAIAFEYLSSCYCCPALIVTLTRTPTTMLSSTSYPPPPYPRHPLTPLVHPAVALPF